MKKILQFWVLMIEYKVFVAGFQCKEVRVDGL